MSPPARAMVLAAGLGTRMRPITGTLPKALVPVAGRTLLDRALDRCLEAGIGEAVVNIHHLGGQIRAHLAGRRAPRIAISDETDALLDTGGGVRKALPLLGPAPVLVTNADAVFAGGSPLSTFAAAPVAPGGATLLLVPRERAHGYTRAGDFFLDGDRPRRRGAAAGAPFVYTGAQLLDPAAMAGTPEGAFSLNLVWDRLAAEGLLSATVWQGDWADVGTPTGIAAAEAMLSAAGED